MTYNEEEFTKALDIVLEAESLALRVMKLRYPDTFDRYITQSGVEVWDGAIEVEFDYYDGGSCDSIMIKLEDLNAPLDTLEREMERLAAIEREKERVKSLREKYTREDWQYEVVNGDTCLGFDAWVDHQVESEEDE